MYRIDEFLKYYSNLQGSQSEIAPDVWVNSKPVDFQYGIFTREYWKNRRQRKKDAKAVLKGKAIAVTWNKEK